MDRRTFIKQGTLAAGAAGWSVHASAGEKPSPALPSFAKGSRLLFIGDSITDMGRDRRANTTDRNHVLGHSYVFMIAGRLGLEMPEAGLEFINRGISGNMVNALKMRWSADVIEMKPDVLTILIGVNDGFKAVAPEAYESDYRDILEASRNANPDLRLILMDPFVLGVDEFDQSRNLASRRAAVDQYREVVARLASDFSAIHIRTQQLFDEALKIAPAAYWLWDGVHPLPQGHELIARAWLEAVGSR